MTAVQPVLPPLAANVAGMPRSGIRELMDLAWSFDDAVHLEVGEPDFDTPEAIVLAAHEAAAAGHTKYTTNAGILPLREAIADKLRRVNGLTVDPDSIVVTHGAVSGLMTAMMATLEPGDEILLPDPGWPNWEMMALAVGAVPVRYRLAPENGFVPDLDEIDELVSERTKVLMVNSPSNPTGMVLSGGMLERLVELANRRGLWVFSDECYDQLVFDVPHVSTAVYDTQDRVISFFSFSKTYAMTGWRVGYAVVPAPLTPAMVKLQEPVLGSPNNVSQKAAEAALLGDQSVVEHMRAAYRARRDLVCDLLTRAGVAHYRPQGAFYLMIDVGETGMSGYEFAMELARSSHVAVSPGSAFGTAYPDLIRISLSSSPEVLRAGVAAIAALVEQSLSAARSPARTESSDD